MAHYDCYRGLRRLCLWEIGREVPSERKEDRIWLIKDESRTYRCRAPILLQRINLSGEYRKLNLPLVQDDTDKVPLLEHVSHHDQTHARSRPILTGWQMEQIAILKVHKCLRLIVTGIVLPSILCIFHQRLSIGFKTRAAYSNLRCASKFTL